jgi:hypothetical protein
MKKIKKFIILNFSFVIVFLILIIPVISLAENTPLVQCDNCGFNDLMALINRVIKFILFDMVIPISAIMFAYAGFLLVFSGADSSGAKTKAKSIFTNTVLGLIIAMAAFLIIRTILSILGYEGSWIGFNPLSDGI